MLKDLKEKIKYISEIVGMISVFGTLIVTITAALYNFGFFSYFSVSIWKLPITISEIITDVVVIFPKLLLILVICSVLLLVLNMLFVLIIECYTFVINIIRQIANKNNKVKIKSIVIKYKMIRYIRKYSENVIFISFLCFLVVLLFSIVWKNQIFYLNPCVTFSICFVFFMFFCMFGKIKLLLFWIFFILLMFFLTMICSGIYDANIESGKKCCDYIVKKDDSTIKDIRILKVYDAGIIVMTLQNKLDFFYSSDIKKYSIDTEKNDIFGDDIFFNTSHDKLLQKCVNLLYRLIRVLIIYSYIKVLNCIYDFSTHYTNRTFVQDITNNVINLLYKKDSLLVKK